MTQRRWIVTGCSTGLGRALAERLATAGEQVLATARDATTLADLPGLGADVVTTTLDVRNAEQCAEAVALATKQFGGVDVLVNNAGYGQFGVVEEITDAELTAQFETNVYGPWRLLRHVLPLWRQQGNGHAIFSSSLSGTIAFPGLSAYTASKFALEALAESTAAEAGPLGIKVTILQLGGFATAYGENLHLPQQQIGAYQPVVAEMLGLVRGVAGNVETSRPALYAETVVRVAEMSAPPLRLPLGLGAFEYLEPALAARQAQFDAVRPT